MQEDIESITSIVTDLLDAEFPTDFFQTYMVSALASFAVGERDRHLSDGTT